MKRYIIISDSFTPYQTDRLDVNDDLGDWAGLVIDTVTGKAMSADLNPISAESWRKIEEFED